MSPAKVAHIMALVEAYADSTHISSHENCLAARAAVEAALRDAPQAEPSDPEDCPAWCPRCDGTGDEVQMSDSSPDAHEVTVNCLHCDGVGTLYAAYTGVVRELAKKHQAYIKACGEIYFSKLKTPSAPTAVEPDERAEFEAWYFDKYMLQANRHLLDPDRYAYPHTQDTWTGWQARASKGTPL